jgi:ankyrin repeat protein
MSSLPGLYFLKDYPQEQLWRLVVDGRFWAKQNGYKGYESREKGSVNASLDTLIYFALQANQTKDFEVSVELIKNIHKRCGKDVEELEDKSPGELRETEPVSFGIPASRASSDGINELLDIEFLQKRAIFGPGVAGVFAPNITTNHLETPSSKDIELEDIGEKIYAQMKKDGFNDSSHFYIAPREDVETILGKITDSYNEKIKLAETLDDKVEVIVSHIKYYEILHPFKDANGRTFVNTLMNTLLMQQGLPPATLYEPNVFDLYSSKELVTVVKEAMFNTMRIIDANKKEQELSLYGYESNEEDSLEFIELLKSPSVEHLQSLKFSSKAQSINNEIVSEFLSTLGKSYPLHWAAIYTTDKKELAHLVEEKILQINNQLSEGAPPLYVGKTPLHIAAMVNNAAMFEALVSNKADLTIQDYDGKTPLHLVAEYGNIELLKLIPSITDVEFLSIQDSQGKTALHYAVESGNRALVSELLLKVPDYINIKDKYDKTALHYAAEVGSHEIAGLLIDNGADVNELDKEGHSPISIACQNKNNTVFDTLLDSGSHISEKTLLFISSNKDVESFAKILNKNKSLLKDKEAFKQALNIGDIGLVNQFLEAGMDIDTKLGGYQVTPLMVAVERKNIELFNFLIEKNADIHLKDSSDNTILHYAGHSRENSEFVRAMLSVDDIESLFYETNTAGNNFFKSAVNHKDYDSMQLYIDKGFDIKTPLDNYNNTALHLACTNSDIKHIITILKMAPSLINVKNDLGQTPLQAALKSTRYGMNEEDMVTLCNINLENGGKLDTTDNDSNGLADFALSTKSYLLYRHLTKQGVTTNISLTANMFLHTRASDVMTNPKVYKQTLLESLNKNPLIAAAQINDLYLKIKDNSITAPQNYTTPGRFSFFSKETNEQKAHREILKILEKSYAEKIVEIPAYQKERIQEVNISESSNDWKLKAREKESRDLFNNLDDIIDSQKISLNMNKSVRLELYQKCERVFEKEEAPSISKNIV